MPLRKFGEKQAQQTQAFRILSADLSSGLAGVSRFPAADGRRPLPARLPPSHDRRTDMPALKRIDGRTAA